MTVTALPGNVKLRKFQLGAESTWGTAVAATRVFPWKFAPTIQPNWTDVDADVGSLDPIVPPYRKQADYTGQTTGPVAFNDATHLWVATAGTAATAAGGAAPYTWTLQPANTSQDVFQLFSAEWGDDTNDWFGLYSGGIDKLTFTYPEDASPVTHTADWRFGGLGAYPFSKTAGLTVDTAPTWMYSADTSIYIDNTAGGIGGTKVANTVHGLTVAISNNLDVKRFLNGSNTRFQASGYGRGARMIESTFTFAKSNAALTEVANWLAAGAGATKRFLKIATVSPEIAGGSTPYSHTLTFAGYWYTRTEGTYATANSTVQLVCRHTVDGTLAYPYKAVLVNSQATSG